MKNWLLIGWLVILIGSMLGATLTKTAVQAPDYEVKVLATEKTIAAFEAIKDYRESLEISLLDPIRGRIMDPQETGMLGYWQTDITTTSGDLDAKLLSLNPAFAAMVIDMLSEVGLQAHDQVGFMASGSFPGLAIASLCALEVTQMDYYAMVSAGASSYGANIPELTLFDMIEVLYQEGILTKRCDAVSFGGLDDTGHEFPSSFQTAFMSRVQTAGVPLLRPTSFEDGIHLRMDTYASHLPHMQCFINVGGHVAALGEGLSTFLDGNGLLLKTKRLYTNERGLINRYLEQQIPVVHLIQVENLCLEYGLSITQEPLALKEDQPLFYDSSMSLAFIITPLVLSIGIMLFVVIKKKNFLR